MTKTITKHQQISKLIYGDDLECRAAEAAACLTFKLFEQVIDDYATRDPS